LVASAASALLLVPSVIGPEEQNVLINPLHANPKTITATKLGKWNMIQGWGSSSRPESGWRRTAADNVWLNGSQYRLRIKDQ
jgi:hypothetical protein